MNRGQAIWWEQARSDHGVLLLLRQRRVAACHQLHYLQMVTEKLGKAYFWRSGTAPPKSHVSFVRFLQSLGGRSALDRHRIATALGFGIADQFRGWIPTISPLAYELERLAPALAGDTGPNPEYPWPRLAPEHAPASYDFDLWTKLSGTGKGKQLVRVIDAAVAEFPRYA